MDKGTRLFDQLSGLSTEQRNPASMNIDTLSVMEVLRLINNEDQKIAAVVAQEIPFIAQAVEYIVAAFRKNGRLLYVGAGTSGRLGVLDAVECPPTFGTSHEMVQGIIAGGEKAMFRAQEGAEDKEENGARDVDEKKIGPDDVVCGIAASLRTPYGIGAVRRAKERGAKTIYLTTNPRTTFNEPEFTDFYRRSIDVAVCLDVGPEIIMGSTRMKSGTAQKMVLNMMTTTAMVRLGKVYENMMVDLQLTNQKLHERAKRILMIAAHVSYDEAGQFLSEVGGHVKTALVMIKAHTSAEDARMRLERANGFVREAAAGTQHKFSENK